MPCCNHKCRSRHIFGAAKDFCPNSPKLTQRNCKKVTYKKWRHFAQIKPCWAPYFQGACSDFQGFCEGFPRFCSDFHRFCMDFKRFWPDFYQIKTFGVALALPSPTPVDVAMHPFVARAATMVIHESYVSLACSANERTEHQPQSFRFRVKQK